MREANILETSGEKIELTKLKQWLIYFVVLSLVGLIFLFDNLTASNIPLYQYYIFPIALSTWLLDRRFSYLLIFFSSFAGIYSLSGSFPQDSSDLYAYNLLQCIPLFIIVELLVNKLHVLYRSNLGSSPSFDADVQHTGEKLGLGTENLVWHTHVISREHHEKRNGHRGAIVWLTGLSGSGKSTLAHGVEEKLHNLGFHTVVLDGDNIRHNLCADLGFSSADRNENIRRVSEVAKLFLEQGIVVLVALISPSRSAREQIRQSLPPNDFFEIYCSCALSVCKQRDPKGMYAKVESGKIKEFTGVSSPYEEPLDPAMIIDTENESVGGAVDRLTQLLTSKLR